MRLVKKKILFSFTSRLSSMSSEIELAKVLQKYVNFRLFMETFLNENKPEDYWPIITIFFEVIDFNIFAQLKSFANDMKNIFEEFIKALRREPWKKGLIQEIQTQKPEFEKIITAFFKYMSKKNMNK